MDDVVYSGFDGLCRALEGDGAFLVVEDRSARVNVMTIGWAQLGVIWGRSVLSVLVRPSRHTFSLLENSDFFSVCVPGPGLLSKELAFCGARSGRDVDKIKACGFKLRDGLKKGIKLIEGCSLTYECSLLGAFALDHGALSEDIRLRYYAGGDPHKIYFGEVLRTP